MSLCPHGYTAFWDCPICEYPMGTRHEQIPIDECDCRECNDWRDNHCPRCGEEWAWNGRSEESRLCAECRYAHIERDPF